MNGVNYVATVLSSDRPVVYTIPKYEESFRPSQPAHPFYTYYASPFTTERYLYSPPPIHLGPFEVKDDVYIPNVLRCPIKISGSRDIVLPAELAPLAPFVKWCCIYEESFNPSFDSYFIHLTYEKKYVRKGESQRVPGFHVDGYQGSKFPIKHTAEHSYLWSSSYGTEFCVQPFFISHIDESKYLIFDELNRQARESNVLTCIPGNVYLFDPYMVHRSPILPCDTERTVLRLTFETVKLLDPNDTVNPHLSFKVPYKYDVRNRLGTYPYALPKEQYGYT